MNRDQPVRHKKQYSEEEESSDDNQQRDTSRPDRINEIQKIKRIDRVRERHNNCSRRPSSSFSSSKETHSDRDNHRHSKRLGKRRRVNKYSDSEDDTSIDNRYSREPQRPDHSDRNRSKHIHRHRRNKGYSSESESEIEQRNRRSKHRTDYRSRSRSRSQSKRRNKHTGYHYSREQWREPTRYYSDTESSTSSSETEYESRHRSNRLREHAYDTARRDLRNIKLLESRKIRFNGTDGPEEFISQIEDQKRRVRMSSEDLLQAITAVFSKEVNSWYRGIPKEIYSWRDLKRALRGHYGRRMTDDDIEEELRRRTQNEDESITDYLNAFRYIASHFKRPISLRQQIKIAKRGLLPTYRKYMSDRRIE
ncbi:splicing regulatory glutamine/lysine-rich protein 1-like [Phymastichus coffea]|uniref:splicing regulatory glutamine/lysine-rich protein 1-like n=1 Tax=Phymastichus coffea TaxID=108790 RepID=UPI00273BAF95|nr:splicing regulatory glutamine/lysine-rich protein 1-like [Phymastichus coffea]